MRFEWTVRNHHLTLLTDSGFLYPTASQIFEYKAGVPSEKKVGNPFEELPNLKCSRFGSQLQCELRSTDNNEIELFLYTQRRGNTIPVDFVDGMIIDHCVFDDEWFFLNGDFLEISQIMKEAGICSLGRISFSQYLILLKCQSFLSDCIFVDKVDEHALEALLFKEAAVPSGIRANLYDYQKTGYSWILNYIRVGLGCILGDEMGLGKTLQIITLFEKLKALGSTPFLVVAPVSLLQNWKNECNKFAPNLDVAIHHGTKRTGLASKLLEHDVIIISYNSAVTDLSLLKMIHWKCVILDEAQNIKNPNSWRAKSVKSLPRDVGVAVTGTPFENHITDIWSLVDFAIPGLFGPLSEFQKTFTDDVLGATRIEPILSKIMIRRRVFEVANSLPEKIVIPQSLEMQEKERDEYELIRQEALKSTKDGSGVSLAQLQKLRQYCTHPFLCNDCCGDNPAEKSIKYQRFCEIVEEVFSRNEKVIVFTSYKKMFDIFKEDLPRRFGYPVDYINGDTPVAIRQSIVDRFNTQDGSAILILNPRAAGTGLNITGANHVIHFNLEWNPALEDQASARAYRNGQKRNVFIYRLYYSETVEQIIDERIERKRRISDTAVVGSDGVTDIEDIIRALEIAPKRQKGEI